MRNIRNVSVDTALPFGSCFVVRAMCLHYKVRLMPEGFGCCFWKVKRRSEHGKNRATVGQAEKGV